MKRTFDECDEIRGCDIDPLDTMDHRLCKHLRQHQRNISMTPMPDQFKAVKIIKLPKTMLVDIDASEATSTELEVDRGDVYEAFWRTSELTLRGIFINGEPVWGEVGYRNGMSYNGSLSGGQPHGFGVKQKNGSIYKGRFKNGFRHGRGIMVEANQYRLYVGTFSNDRPNGIMLCIQFGWCTNAKTVQHSRRLLSFDDNGVVTKTTKAPNVNITDLSGLAPEEFLQMYRHAEKLVEDFMTKKFLRKHKADEVLWTPVGL